MFDSVVVPVEPDMAQERAVAVAEVVAGLAGLHLQLVTVVPPEAPADPVRAALEDRASRTSVPCDAVVLVGPDVATALEEHLSSRPDALIVLASRARGLVGELLLGSTSELLLSRLDRPILLVGPRVPGSSFLGESVVAAVSDLAGGRAMLPWLESWVTSLGGEPWIVQVASPGSERTSAAVKRLASALRERGVDAQWDVLHGRSTTDALVDFATCMSGGILVVASERWTDPQRVHWASTARSLVHQSPYPVLVVPLHRHPRELAGTGAPAAASR